MRETYPFNIDRKETGGIPLSTAQDGAIDAKKHRIQMFADDLSRMLNGTEKPKHRWQLVDKAGKPTDLSSAIAALDAKPKQRLANTLLPKSRAEQKSQSTVTPLARQQQSQSDKAALVDRLYGGRGSLEAKFWPDA